MKKTDSSVEDTNALEATVPETSEIGINLVVLIEECVEAASSSTVVVDVLNAAWPVLVEEDADELNNDVEKLVAEKAASVVEDPNTGKAATVESTTGGGVVGSAVGISEDFNILEVCEDEEPNLE